MPTFDRQQDLRSRGARSALIHDYVLTPAVAAKASKTRRDYLHHIGHLEAEFGGKLMRLPKIPGRAGSSCRDRVAGASDAHDADYRLAVLSEIPSCSGSIVVDSGWLRRADRGEALAGADRRDAVWTGAEVDRVLSKAPPRVALPVLIVAWTGQRQGDILSLTWRQYDGEFLRLKQGKTRRHLKIKVAAPLRAVLEIRARQAA